MMIIHITELLFFIIKIALVCISRLHQGYRISKLHQGYPISKLHQGYHISKLHQGYRISKLHQGYDPLQYPLIFPYGTDDWLINLKLQDGKNLQVIHQTCFMMQ